MSFGQTMTSFFSRRLGLTAVDDAARLFVYGHTRPLKRVRLRKQEIIITCRSENNGCSNTR